LEWCFIQLQEQAEDGNDDETIAESGRLYVRNLSYLCTEEDLEKHFGKFGPLAEVHLPIDTFTKKVKGFAFITYVIPEHGVKAYTECDGTVFQGRMLHILPAKTKKDPSEDASDESSFKKKRQAQQKAHAGSSHNWNSLFLGANAVADVIAEKYGTSKSQLLDPESRQSVGVRMALGETHVVSETRDFLTENGVSLEAFSQGKMERSKTVMLVKNLPSGTPAEEIRTIFSKHGTVSRVILPPSGVTAIVEFLEPSEARRAFRNLAYTKFQHVPLYLEWAPVGVFTAPAQEQNQATGEGKESVESSEMTGEENPRLADKEEEEDEEAVNEPGSTLFVKNLNFDTTDEGLKQFFSSVGKVKVATVAKKKDMKKPGNFLSMGYGFVEFRGKPDAMKALKQLQHNKLDGHSVELKISERTTLQKQPTSSKKSASKKQTSTKVLIRNIPFEASLKEIRELFSTFGEIKSVRLPKKLSGTGSHRGFGFVDFLSKQDAKRAFNALCHSTHLFGRRLVLEWADTEETVEQLRKKTAEHFHEDVPRKKKKKSDLMEDLQAGGGD
ncbi:probable RNA-binding protein 19, partial [Lingula anatina]|uniref:Probable RNA-binding protein 19 n=1 Tax=Lingula anatina TaxID=7574 RepID=A0A2R2MT15_LINAN